MKTNNKTLLIGLTAALVFVVLGVFIFSFAMETLDVKAEALGAQEQPIWTAPFADYTIAGSDSQWVALAVGITATLVIFAIGIGVAKLIRKKKIEKPELKKVQTYSIKIPTSLKDLMESIASLTYVEDLSEKRGIMQAINPVAKLFAIIGMIVASLFITNLTYLLAICLVPLFLAVTSRIPLKHFFMRTAIVTVLSALISIFLPFTTAGTPVWAASMSGINIAITIEGLIKLAVFTVRVWFCVASLILLVLSTGFDRTIKMLATLRVPTVILQLFSLTYRYFFVSIEEAQSVLIAKEARTYVHKQNFNLQSLKDLGSIIASLFIRTYERSERVYLAMKARGFQIEADNRHSMPKLRISDIAFTACIIVSFAVIVLL